MSTTGDEILTSDNKIWVIATHTNSVKKVWNSSDGISWTLSATNLPATDNYSSEFIFYDEHLWCFRSQEKTCWKSGDDGDSWTLVTTNLFVSTSAEEFEVTTYDGKLWITSNPDYNSSYLSWSTNGINWNLLLAAEEPLKLAETEDGRLWAFAEDSIDNALYIIGGPKKQDGLYYYRKD